VRRHLGCVGLAFAVALPAAGAAAGDAQTAFEVIVLRGASVARVRGDASGALREAILREDPRPARREPRPPALPDPGREIVVVVDAGSGYPAGYGPFAPFYPGPWLAPCPYRPRRVYRPGSVPPAFHHATFRGHRPGASF
jgi:hypothetical protein